MLQEKSKDPSYLSAQRMVRRILKSPVLSSVLCGKTNFTFNKNSVNMARLNRAEAGDFDCLALGLFLLATFKGQFVVPDGGFYLRDAHINLIRKNQLIMGVYFLGELPPKLRQAVLLIEDKTAKGAIAEDAETLADYTSRFPRGTIEWKDAVKDAMS
jgi:hypothetical protein